MAMILTSKRQKKILPKAEVSQSVEKLYNIRIPIIMGFQRVY